MKDYASLLIFLFVLVQTTHRINSQDNKNFQKVLGKLTTYASNQSPEKTYIQTDKDYYANGETIWFKTYLLDGITHYKSDKSKVIYIELVNAKDSVISQKKMYVQDLGASGDMAIPKNIEQGKYSLRAYTKYMLNELEPTFHSKEISIWFQKFDASVTETSQKVVKNQNASAGTIRPKINFFPEGGYAVSGMTNVFGIKATDIYGNGVSLEGKIIDENENMVTPFKCFDYGLGKVSFLPEIGKVYFAKIDINGVSEKYKLPNILDEGYVLNARNKGGEIILAVATNKEENLKETMLLGHLRGRLILKHIEKSDKSSFTIKLLTKELQSGVAQFTLFTQSGEAVSERLVFIRNPNREAIVDVKPDAHRYEKRNKTTITISLKDIHGAPLQGEFSSSVATINGISKAEGSTIESWLLLNSDIGAHLSNLAFFFNDSSSEKQYLLDALMLTHGWRRFVWKELLDKNVSKKFRFEPEKGIFISGKTTDYNNKYRPKPSFTTLNVLQSGIYQEKKVSDSQGNFLFGPFIFQDSVDAIIHATPLKETNSSIKNEIAIYVNKSSPNVFLNSKKTSKNTSIKLQENKAYLKQVQAKRINDFRYNPDVTQLEEVEVTAKKKTRKEIIDEKISEFTLYGTADTRIFPDSVGGMEAANIFELLRTVPGVRVTGAFPNQSIRIRGISSFTLSTDPLFLLDDVPIDASFASSIQANEVLFVDVLKGADAAIYGFRGANGVVAIYTQRDLFLDDIKGKRNPNVTNVKIAGFYKTREFFSPDYSVSRPEHVQGDYRTTLHWQPKIKTNENGEAQLEFYTGDSTGEYQIKVEGITFDGSPFSSSNIFTVEE
ncbi:TonB-dependent receptor plug domain-containing protein [Maribacter sp. 2210JD10-5]|uniref:TonB-dependent receptor plug domain-containing protein n=1 Tax=Maribacter sp. 2210JD10-5 TaxID=3386272 RepID=UPI0039BCFDDA